MKIPAFLALGTALLVPAVAHAQLPPGVNPGVANQAAQRAQQTDILYWYNLLPPQIFGVFGETNRLELLQSKGAIYDKNRGFIEVLVPGDADKNDVEKLQVKLYQGNQGVMVAVSQIVWNQPRVKGALAFFALGNDGNVFDVTRQVFPFTLTATPDNNAARAEGADAGGMAPDAGGANAGGAKTEPPINAYLSRADTMISTGIPETETPGDDYVWNGTIFAQAEDRNDERDDQ